MNDVITTVPASAISFATSLTAGYSPRDPTGCRMERPPNPGTPAFPETHRSYRYAEVEMGSCQRRPCGPAKEHVRILPYRPWHRHVFEAMICLAQNENTMILQRVEVRIIACQLGSSGSVHTGIIFWREPAVGFEPTT